MLDERDAQTTLCERAGAGRPPMTMTASSLLMTAAPCRPALGRCTRRTSPASSHLAGRSFHLLIPSYAVAVETLARSEKLNATPEAGSHPGDLAFLAMAQHQRGQ